MEADPLKIYRKIVGVNLRHNFIPHLGVAAAIFVLTPLLFNVTDLSGREAARPIEFLLSWTGVVFLTPVFWPEQDGAIRDVICARKTDHLKVCMIRVLYSAFTLLVLSLAFVGMMYLRESRVSWAHVLCAVATAFFLGAMGLAGAGISDNAVAGYMVALMFYLACYGLKEKLGVFNIFSMYATGEHGDKWWQLAAGAALIAMTFAILRFRRSR